ncbi:TetR/AcrR family transcriptional regulator [Gordonia neofelifaecis]|uniref:TetR family transcriptional regulator n=1 Tax=Gordonia neofelifaecis NRRL B-59395 TaxID=644548 RepID=F1YFR9_9ACTN|nr:TetR/AcrR family transcriptional regulator [Gordonia neofelifaecis]EGD56496.1 TetR family transcriptional regulator [Gordonia neofelifaecis NRRL B-59395]
MTKPIARRPKDRKAQILDAARTLVVSDGYANVSMAQIADEVGITAGALYRHFANKAVLLAAVIGTSFDDVMPVDQDDDRLRDVVEAACRSVVARPDVGVLWWRESRSLPDDLRAELAARLREVNQRYARLIRVERGDVDDRASRELAWGVQAILASPGFHATRLPPADYVDLLTSACLRVCAVTPGPADASRRRRGGGLTPVSKREAMLGHAIELFARNGYDATSLSDIGAAAGVSGPNTYSYFASKSELMEVCLDRGTTALWLTLHDVLAENDEPRRALAAVVRSYARLAVDKTILTPVLGTDVVGHSDSVRARQREYVAEWTGLVVASRPELTEIGARLRVHTALGLINILTRIDHLAESGSFESDLAAMAIAVLLHA